MDEASVFSILDPGDHYYLELSKKWQPIAQHKQWKEMPLKLHTLRFESQPYNSPNFSFFMFRLPLYHQVAMGISVKHLVPHLVQ